MAATRVSLALALFAPRPGGHAFVELVNVGERPVDLSSMVLGIDSIIFPLSRLASPVAPGGRILIRFDGGGQLARDSAFAQLIIDQTVTQPQVSSGPVSPGVYWWRVQAIGANDAVAAWAAA